MEFFRFVSRAIEVLKPKHFIIDGPHQYNMAKMAHLSSLLPPSNILSAFTSSASPIKRSKMIWSNLEMCEPEKEEHLFFRGGIPAHNWSKSRRDTKSKTGKKQVQERVAINGLINNIVPEPVTSETVTFFPDKKIDLLLNPDLRRKVDKLHDTFFYRIKREWVINANEAEKAMGLPAGWTSALDERKRLVILGQSTPVQFWKNLLKPCV